MKRYTKEQLSTYFIDVLGLSEQDCAEYSQVAMIQYLKDSEQEQECREYLG